MDCSIYIVQGLDFFFLLHDPSPTLVWSIHDVDDCVRVQSDYSQTPDRQLWIYTLAPIRAKKSTSSMEAPPTNHEHISRRPHRAPRDAAEATSNLRRRSAPLYES